MEQGGAGVSAGEDQRSKNRECFLSDRNSSPARPEEPTPDAPLGPQPSTTHPYSAAHPLRLPGKGPQRLPVQSSHSQAGYRGRGTGRYGLWLTGPENMQSQGQGAIPPTNVMCDVPRQRGTQAPGGPTRPGPSPPPGSGAQVPAHTVGRSLAT